MRKSQTRNHLPPCALSYWPTHRVPPVWGICPLKLQQSYPDRSTAYQPSQPSTLVPGQSTTEPTETETDDFSIYGHESGLQDYKSRLKVW
jgi:hypothetical protein